MDLTCLICSDLLTPGSETFSTPCGHIFHYACLIQWIERSKTCPQCRNKCSEKSIHRIYFNLANGENTDDVATLQSKYDNAKFQLMLKEKDVKIFTDKYRHFKEQNARLREEVMNLEKDSRSHDSVLHALKDQIHYFKNKSKDRDKVLEDMDKLKQKLRQLEAVDMAVNGTREDMTEMLKNETNVENLVILVSTLKKALLDGEKKKRLLEYKNRQLQNDVTRFKRDVSVLELSNKDLQNKLEAGDSTKEKRTITKLAGRGILNIDGVSGVDKAQDSPSLEEKVTKIIASDSPYLRLKKGYDLLEPKKLLLNHPGTRNVSIFKRSYSEATEPNPNSDYMYDGFGGHCKEDVFPSSKGIKRYGSVSAVASKMRKVSGKK